MYFQKRLNMQFNTIGQKIGLGFSIIAIILALSIGATIVQINETEKVAQRINNLRKPTATASLQMLNGINQSLAALRGWMILGEEKFRKERKETWEKRISGQLTKLKAFSKSWTNPENIERLENLEKKIILFETAQQEIENIAQSSKNLPAKEIISNKVDPLGSKINKLISTIIEIEMGNSNTYQRKGLFKKMADFRGSMGMSLANIQAFINTANENNKKEYIRFWEINTEALNYLKGSTQFLNEEQLEAFNKIVTDRVSLEDLFPKLISIRESPQWNFAQYWLGAKAAPLANQIKAILESMAANQQVLMDEDLTLNEQIISNLYSLLIFVFILSVTASSFIGIWLKRKITKPIKGAVDAADFIAAGNLDEEVKVSGLLEAEILGSSLMKMQKNLRITRQSEGEALELLNKEKEKLQQEDWVKTQYAVIIESLQGIKDLREFASIMINKLTPMVEGNLGVFYLNEKTEFGFELHLYASYAYSKRKNVSDRFKLGEGLIGQCALEKKPILLTQIPDDYIQISSGLGEASPKNITVLPVLYEENLMGVFEIASFKEFAHLKNQLLEQVASNLGIMIDNISHTIKTQELLEEAQRQSEELQTQQVEMKATNEELEKQREVLEEKNRQVEKQAQELQTQQIEMRATNEELEIQQVEMQATNEELETQQIEMKAANEELEKQTQIVEEKSKQLALSSKYKSEFLANMSHELRTPLNSLLVLSKILADDDVNLTAKQKEYATTIHESGNDLLGLLNDVLDLSKIEAGKIDLNPTIFNLEDVTDYINRLYEQVALDKNLNFEINILDSVPPLYSDLKRLQQILVNLLSNAFKFTEKGSVILEIGKAKPNTKFNHPSLTEMDNIISFCVWDTGIGIPTGKLGPIFEAFQQADGSTSRKYGGTGLGLSICRELSQLLCGEIHLESVYGQGSRFTLYIPVSIDPNPEIEEVSEVNIITTPSKPVVIAKEKKQVLVKPEKPKEKPKQISIKDNLPPILILDTDSKRADYIEKIVVQGGGQAIREKMLDSTQNFAKENMIGAVFINTDWAKINGITPLKTLKEDAHFRGVPFYAICKEDDFEETIDIGIKGIFDTSKGKNELKQFCLDIVDRIRNRKKVLLVEDNRTQRKILSEFISTESILLTEAITGKRAVNFLNHYSFDCMILDLSLPDKSGIDILRETREQTIHKELPIIIYTAKDISTHEERELKQLSQKIIIKSAKSPQRLLEELAHLLNDHGKKKEKSNDNVSLSTKATKTSLKEKSLLIVDDDMRNIFAITSAMENFGATVDYAQGGNECIEKLNTDVAVDLILMDIMMPEMDGYKAIEKIRTMPGFNRLPIIVITAKSMKGEREKCIKAGASDYLTKPLNMDLLVEKIQVCIE